MTFKELVAVLLNDKPSEFIKEYESDIFYMIPELGHCKGFDHKNKWHGDDVYEHTLRVVDNLPKNLILRLSALFHDLGKPSTCVGDENGIRHFPEHWLISEQIFEEFARKYNLDKDLKIIVGKLVLYHDVDIEALNETELRDLMHVFSKEELIMLFQLKKADLLTLNTEYYYLVDECQTEGKKLINRYER